MSLPDAWVERLHARLMVRFGARWLRMWEGIDAAALRADWGDVLSGLSADAIATGIERLPVDQPPTATQFRDLCRAAVPGQLAIPHDRPAPNPQRLAELRRRLAGATAPKNPAEMAQRVFARLRIARDSGTDPETRRPVSTAQLDFLRRAEAGLGRATEGDPS